MAHSIRGFTSLVCGTFAMCDGVSAQVAPPHDSAGIRVVVNATRIGAPVLFRLGSTPTLDVGGVEANPSDEFDHKMAFNFGAARLADGGLAVTEMCRLHLFDKLGRRRVLVGRCGAGPDDFGSIRPICSTRGDTLVIEDARNHRIAIATNAGVVVRTIPERDLGYLPLQGCFDDGTFILSQQIPAAPGAERAVRISRLHTDGSVASVIMVIREPPFDGVAATDPSFVAIGQRLYFGPQDRSEVEVYNPSGKLAEIIRSHDRLRPITRGDVERKVSFLMQNPAVGQLRAAVDKVLARPHNPYWPAYKSLFAAPNGWIWMEDYRVVPWTEPDTWTAFDSSGNVIGRLVIPVRPGGNSVYAPQILGFGANDVLVRRTDDDGAAHLTVYPLESIRPNR